MRYYRLGSAALALIGFAAFQLLPVAFADNAVDCMETERALAYWRPIRAQAATADLPADVLALQLVPCLGSRNSELRDRIAYEFFTYWLRREKLTDRARTELLHLLSDRIDVEPEPMLSDAAFSRSFSALILAELLRSDIEHVFMIAAERDGLLQLTLQALSRENDYRGLEPDIGWVHPVAHQSDLLWRFAQHPKTTTTQAQAILNAIRDKASITDAAYRFNEGDRLARSATTVVLRGLVDAEWLVRWLSSFEAPRSMPAWEDAYRSLDGMAELHNCKQFLRAFRDQLDGEEIDESVRVKLYSLLARFSRLV